MHQTTRLLIFSAFILLNTVLFAQNKTVILDGLKIDAPNYIFARDLDLSPGDTIAIPAGQYGAIRFYDVTGLPGMPITIINQGGLVEVVEDQVSAFEMLRSSYIRLTGTGVGGITYGFKLKTSGSGAQGVNITNLSTDIEIDHVEVAEAGFAGIMMKTDPSCSNPDTWRGNFIMRNLSIHHNKIHHVGGEGIYIGYTGSAVNTSNKSCIGSTIFGHWLEDVEIAHNTVFHTGQDAIQLNLTRRNGIIRDNTVRDYGKKENTYQSFAFSIGAGEYQVYNNKAVNKSNGNGRGIQLLAASAGSRVYNNILVAPKEHGIFVHSRAPLSGDWGYVIANNTIVDPEFAGIKYNARITDYTDPMYQGAIQDSIPVYFANNLIVSPGYDYVGGPTWKQDNESYIDFNDRGTRDAMASFTFTNMGTRNMDSLLLRNPSRNNFKPAEYHSPLVEAGTDLSALGIHFDFANKKRPSGDTFDIGAFEFRVRQVSEKQVNNMTEDVKGDETELGIYPNPTTVAVTLQNPDYTSARITLYRMDGIQVANIRSHELQYAIDVSSLPTDTYYLLARYPDGSKTTHLLAVER